MRLKVELFSTFQRKARRRSAHQCHTRPIWLRTQPRFIGAGQKTAWWACGCFARRTLPRVFEVSTFLETRLVCFSPKASAFSPFPGLHVKKPLAVEKRSQV